MSKKNIIFVTNHFQSSDGTTRVLLNLVNNLDLEKYNITIKPLYKLERSLLKEVKSGIIVKKFFGFYFKGLNRIVSLIPKKLLYKMIVDKKYDIEIAFQREMPTFIVANSTNSEAIHICWMHGYEFYEKEYSMVDKVVCVSRYCRDKARGEAVNPTIKNKILTLYNLNNDKMIINASKDEVDISINSDCINLITVGRLSNEKGFIRLVKILARLRDENFNFKLYIIGDGPERQQIEDTIKNLNMYNYVFLLGKQENPHKYTSKVDLFVCSSYTEGYSTACTEAAILNIPILTTDVPGANEIINDCECGIVVDNNDDALYSGLKNILNNPAIIMKWKDILKTTSYKFSLENRKVEITNFFNDLDEKNS